MIKKSIEEIIEDKYKDHYSRLLGSVLVSATCSSYTVESGSDDLPEDAEWSATVNVLVAIPAMCIAREKTLTFSKMEIKDLENTVLPILLEA